MLSALVMGAAAAASGQSIVDGTITDDGYPWSGPLSSPYTVFENYEIPADARDAYLVVAVQHESDPLDGLSFAGTDMDPTVSQEIDPRWISIFTLPVTAGTVGDIVVTWSDNQSADYTAFVVSDVSSVSSLGVLDGGDGSTVSSFDVVTPANALTIVAAITNDGAGALSSSGGTTVSDEHFGGSWAKTLDALEGGTLSLTDAEFAGALVIEGIPVPEFTSSPDVIVVDGDSGTGFHTVTATDPAGGNLTFTISGGEDASDFEITAGGVLTYIGDDPGAQAFSVGTPTDDDTDSEYLVEVTATSDAGDMVSGTQNLAILVNAASAPTVSGAAIDVSGETGTGGAFIVGDTVTVEWDNTSFGDGEEPGNAGVNGVTVDFTEFGGGNAVVATEDGGVWTATFEIVEGTIDIVDATAFVTATNPTGPTTGADADDVVVDNQSPAPTDVNVNVSSDPGGDGVYTNGETVTLTWDNSVAGDNIADIVGAIADFSAIGGPADVAATETDGVWTASYTIDATSSDVEAPGANLSLTATDDAGNTGTVTDMDTGVEVDVAGVVISDPSGPAAENGANATYEISLSSTPAGAVEITATADAESVISLNGVDFATTQVISLSDTTPQTVTVQAVDDTDIELGNHSTTITHEITSSADALNYPADGSLPVASIEIELEDNEFFAAVASGSTPANGEGQGSPAVSDETVAVPAGLTESMLVITIGAEGTPGPSQVLWGTEEMTQAGEGNDFPTHVSVWYLLNPTAGEQNIEITWEDGDGPFGQLAYITYAVVENINQEGPVVEAFGTDELGTAESVSHTFADLPTDTFLVDAVSTNDDVSGTFTVGEGQAILGEFGDPGAGGGHSHAGTVESQLQSGEQTQSISWTGNVRTAYVAVAFRNSSVPVPAAGFGAFLEDFMLDPALSFDDTVGVDRVTLGEEWVFGGNPNEGTPTSELYQQTLAPDGALVLTFTRSESSKATTDAFVEYDVSPDFPAPTQVVIPAAEGMTTVDDVTIDVVDNGSDPDSVTVTIPASKASADGSLFARVGATQN
ncbi:MAG: beta strand repeat-containing protein [Opitutales bacterium]